MPSTPLTRFATSWLSTLSHEGRGERSIARSKGSRGRRLRQQPQPEILRDVGVLILVHQNVFEAALVLPQHVRMLAEQPDILQQQIAEVGGVENLQPLLIGRIKLAALAVAKHRGFTGWHLRWRQSAILPAVDQPGQHPRRPALVVDVLGLQKLLQQTDLVVGIEHGEIGFQLHQFGMEPQDASADGMERAEPWHALDRLAEHLAEPVLHLARRLVGEGDGENFLGPRAASRENMRDA